MASPKDKTLNDLMALGRIITLIKAYRHQIDDYQILTRNQALDAYLKQRLSRNEWILWQSLSESEKMALRNPSNAEA